MYSITDNSDELEKTVFDLAYRIYEAVNHKTEEDVVGLRIRLNMFRHLYQLAIKEEGKQNGTY